MEHHTHNYDVEGPCDMTEETRKIPTSVFAVRTTAGQEKNVANMIAIRVETAKLPIKAVLVPELMKGYVFVEAEGPHFVEQAISGIKHVRSRVPGLVTFSEIERYVVVRPVIEELGISDIVEIVGGPFKGMRAKITQIDKGKEEVTLELLEATFTLPITVHADYVRLVERAKVEGETAQ
jgi:transcriptional antiterminator NusG